jgi:hypothetical protein
MRRVTTSFQIHPGRLPLWHGIASSCHVARHCAPRGTLRQAPIEEDARRAVEQIGSSISGGIVNVVCRGRSLRDCF